jgi:murein L,D-transpeptidase YcbB/YkuD
MERVLADPAWPDELRGFYAARDMRPVFIVAGAARADTPALLDSIDALVADGLHPAAGMARTRALLAGASDADSMATLDLLLTTLWLDAARGLSGARVIPARVDTAWSVVPQVPDLWAVLTTAAQDGGLVVALTALRPQHEGYARLRQALARYRSGAAGPPDPVRERQLIANLERWRWLPRRLEAPYLVVDIPAFELQVHDSGGVTRSRVILGRSDWRTPLVHSTVTHVVLAPPWRVPDEIARREILPLIRADTGYLGRHGFLVYRAGTTRRLDPATIDWTAPDTALRVRLVQQPGPTNPLGRVKLVFANQFAIALHDTPAPGLFDNGTRALSHGCVRVEGALPLAARLLAGTGGWDVERLTSTADAGTTRWIALPRPVPVYVTYFTAWVDDEGVLRFRDDLYGWDAALAAALGF